MTNSMSQQEFLRAAMSTLGMTRESFAKRIGAEKRRLDNWLLPSESKEYREMDEVIWRFVREILKNAESMKANTH